MQKSRHSTRLSYRRTSRSRLQARRQIHVAQGMATGMELTPLIQDPSLDIQGYVQSFINRFGEDVNRIMASVR